MKLCELLPLILPNEEIKLNGSGKIDTNEIELFSYFEGECGLLAEQLKKELGEREIEFVAPSGGMGRFLNIFLKATDK